MSSGITRREALQGIGAVTGAALLGPRLAGCGSEPGQITTIVTLMMENRSYDHYLGARKLLHGLPGDGLVAGMQNPDMAGVMRPIYRETVDCVADPPHGWTPSRTQFNGGLNDGFMREYQRSEGVGTLPHVMGYFGREELPITWALADSYTSCDRWFASVMGPTWPNRFYLHSAQSNGERSNNVQTTTWPTIYTRLDAAGIPWNYYFCDAPVLGVLPPTDSSRWKHVRYDFFDDAAAGTLPPVVSVDPAFLLNDAHPPHHPLLAEQFISVIYHALATSPQWKNTLFVVTFDEHGGFYDHVPPPLAPDDRAAAGFNQLGFRVPTIIIGPYVKQGHVSSTQHDHTSVLKHIETMFGLAPLTMRDAAANDLSDAIDLDRLAAGDAAEPFAVPALEVDESMLDPFCRNGGGFKRTELELFLDAGGIPREHDLRGEVRDLAYDIGARLDRWGAGRIVRTR